MKTIIKKIEKEIENQLDVKNEKNDFTTTNIEAILKVWYDSRPILYFELDNYIFSEKKYFYF